MAKSQTSTYRYSGHPHALSLSLSPQTAFDLTPIGWLDEKALNAAFRNVEAAFASRNHPSLEALTRDFLAGIEMKLNARASGSPGR